MTDPIESTAKAQLVKDQACFSSLSEGEREELTGLFEDKWFKAGETLVREGDFVDSVFLIVKGTVDVRHITMENKEIPPNRVHPRFR